jgi:hypothetical protein
MDRWLADPVLLGWLECTIEFRPYRAADGERSSGRVGVVLDRELVADLGFIGSKLESWSREQRRRLKGLRARLGEMKAEALELAKPKNRAERRALHHRLRGRR